MHPLNVLQMRLRHIRIVNTWGKINRRCSVTKRHEKKNNNKEPALPHCGPISYYYIWPLNNIGWNCMAPLIHGFFFFFSIENSTSLDDPRLVASWIQNLGYGGTVDTEGWLLGYTQIFHDAEGWTMPNPSLHCSREDYGFLVEAPLGCERRL